MHIGDSYTDQSMLASLSKKDFKTFFMFSEADKTKPSPLLNLMPDFQETLRYYNALIQVKEKINEIDKLENTNLHETIGLELIGLLKNLSLKDTVRISNINKLIVNLENITTKLVIKDINSIINSYIDIENERINNGNNNIGTLASIYENSESMPSYISNDLYHILSVKLDMLEAIKLHNIQVNDKPV